MESLPAVHWQFHLSRCGHCFLPNAAVRGLKLSQRYCWTIRILRVVKPCDWATVCRLYEVTSWPRLASLLTCGQECLPFCCLGVSLFARRKTTAVHINIIIGTNIIYAVLTFYILPVTWCTNSLTFNNCTFCPHTVFMCFVFIWEQTSTCATYSTNWLVFITEMKSVYCAVRTGSLNKAVCASYLKG